MEVKDINAGSAGSSPSGFVNVYGTIFFIAIDATHGNELWKTDSTANGTVLAKDIKDGVRKAAVAFQGGVVESHKVDLLSQWEGFGRFCRETLEVEQQALISAFGLEGYSPETESLATSPDVCVDEDVASGWQCRWTRAWRSRFKQ